MLFVLETAATAAGDMCQHSAAWWQFGRKRGVRCVSYPDLSHLHQPSIPEGDLERTGERKGGRS